jgi:hypothetical protein
MLVDQSAHEEVRGRLDAYARRVVEPGERGTIEAHLAVCRECRRAAITAIESVSLLVDEPLRVPPEVWDGIVARATTQRPTPAVPRPAPGRAGTG